MSRSPVLTTLAASALAGFFMVASTLNRGDLAFAQQARPAGNGLQVELKRPDLKSMLDEADEVAALEALQVTLSEVGDGSTFVWYRRNGRVSGVFHPTSSFKDMNGRVCRHLQMMLTSGLTSRRTEGVACRQPNGVWSLEG
jgi:surface antigen